MSFLKNSLVAVTVASAFGAGLWLGQPAATKAPEVSSPAAAPAMPAAPAAMIPPQAASRNIASIPLPPPGANPLADTFGRSLPGVPAGFANLPVPAAVKARGLERFVDPKLLDRAQNSMNRIGPDALTFLRDDLRLSESEMNDVSAAQTEMEANLKDLMASGAATDPAEMNKQMKNIYAGFNGKLETVMGQSNTQRFQQFRAAQFQNFATGVAAPGVPGGF